ncbi:endonuclease/exonuclease/phosphatase family protein (macronuclear) [Tetrahymena thermophila SB210]|uniref:Endonuclease/exonuclease/phosphatase family protein n=1 Tax=Tetrahymena thermophila (strain SB210) TaxID=312017 RepID=Q23PW5_TETTS|nr:endonuclease/exonuclease/phosphatase family protein [Tetrahymena thermophila SB210]EAR98570.2 endonuclease/exonuclease/phosphatase family protein [Tetrahymena thermophila SB210]|eukprot:XP_001018815.2 endonuclease/exonuclease/phosphatase family protein [Tetrahymena thermophila SB210]
MKSQLIVKNPLFSNLINWINPFSRRTIKVWGANVASLNSKGNDLKELLDQKKPDVVLLNETWLKSEETFDDPNYLEIATDFNQKHQGTAILLRINSSKYYSCYQVSHSNKNLTEIVLRLDPENKIHFISVYAPPQGNENRDEQREKALSDFYSTVREFKFDQNYKCIGYSDFNARLRKFVDKQDADAKNLLESLKSIKLNLIYDLKPSSFTRSGTNSKNEASQSYIDYFFYRNLSYKKFKILDSIGKSDHSLLEVQIKKQIKVKLLIYLIAFLIMPLFLYHRKDITLQMIINQAIDFLDDFFSKENFGKNQLEGLKQSIQTVLPETHKQSLNKYTISAIVAIAFSFIIILMRRLNIFFR